MPTETPDPDIEHGADWFLEAIGAVPPPPTGSEAIDELTRENDIVPDTAAGDRSGATTQIVQTTQVTTSSFDGSPGTTNAAFAPAPLQKVATLEVAPPLPPPPPSPEAADAAAATVVADVEMELSRPLRARRSFRWPIVIVLVLMIIAVGVAAIFMPRAVEAEAVTVRQMYYDVTADVRSYIPEAQIALDSITDKSSDIAQLSAAIPRIAQLDSRSFAMQTEAAEPLPSTFPLVPTGAIDALIPLQDTTGRLGDDGSDLAERLGNAYFYRVSIPGLMQTGNLPTAATTETINRISATLASSLADDARFVSQLPDDPIFEDVHTLAEDSHERYGSWQTEYLAALADDDRGTAQVLIAEINATGTALAEANTEALGAFRAEFDAHIVGYAGELDVHMSNLSRG